jgi:hypothetical protein
MRYLLGDDELALVIRPSMNETGVLDIDTKVVINKSNDMDDMVLAYAHHMLTMMSAFWIWCEENDAEEVFESVEELRNNLLGFTPEEDEDNSYKKEGNVIRLTRWTKTEGNA